MIKESIWVTLLALFFGVVGAAAQKTTERFIPVGESPGVSGKYSVIGKVQAIDPLTRTITVVTPAGTHEVNISEECRIWLDRSRLKRTNESGNFNDCQKGRTVEVLFASKEKRGTAAWIKILVER